MAKISTIGHEAEVTATVFIWRRRLDLGSFGHASLQITGGSYISWWPGERLTKATKELIAAELDLTPLLQSSLGADQKALKRAHGLQYDIRGLDMSSAEVMWSDILKKNSKYNVETFNCCHVCFYSLQATELFFQLGWFMGLLYSLLDYPSLGLRVYRVFTPARLEQLLEFLAARSG